MTFFTVQQLASASGRSVRTIRHHVSQGWIKPEPPTVGVRGHRFSQTKAVKWLNLHFPGRKL